jgi:putative transposase
MASRRRSSLRLKGHDYSQPGEYFVTICTADRKCVLGGIVDGKMRLSEIGKIVDVCWRQVPDHFPNTKVGAFQIMPNHVHGIFQIKENTRRGEVTSPIKGGPQISKKCDGTSPVRKVTLGNVVAYFKYQATKHINEMSGTPAKKIFQRSFYDHIIRDDVDQFFIEQYIELNPIMWELDGNNPKPRTMPIETFKKTLQREHGFNGFALERVIEYELGYRQWSEK